MSNRLPYSASSLSDSGPIVSSASGISGTTGNSGSFVTSVNVISGPATSGTITINGTNAGDLLVLVGRMSGGPSITTVTASDPVNGSWNQASVNGFGSTNVFVIFYVQNAGSGSITITYAAGGISASYQMVVADYTGPLGNPLLDMAATPATGSSNAPTSNSLTTTQARELLVSMVGNSSANGLTITAGAGYTVRNNSNGNAALEDQLVTTVGTYTASFGLSSSVNWTILLVSFRLE